MSFRIALTEPLPGELRRALDEQLHRAAHRLRDPDADRVTAVHDARKAVKKSRALLRLARPGLPRAEVRALNADLRDAGGLLSDTRDADVLRATFDALAERSVGRLPDATFARARAALEPTSPNGAAGDPAAETADRLEAIAGRADALPWDAVGAADLVRGVVTAYRAGRDALGTVRERPTVEALHDWRKRVKDLWYHERLLQDLWPEVLPAYAAESKRLSELLGDDHDLAVLHDALRAAGADELLPLVDERRGELRRAALQLGSRVYADAPRAVRRRLRRWWDAAQDDAETLPA